MVAGLVSKVVKLIQGESAVDDLVEWISTSSGRHFNSGPKAGVAKAISGMKHGEKLIIRAGSGEAGLVAQRWVQQAPDTTDVLGAVKTLLSVEGGKWWLIRRQATGRAIFSVIQLDEQEVTPEVQRWMVSK